MQNLETLKKQLNEDMKKVQIIKHEEMEIEEEDLNQEKIRRAVQEKKDQLAFYESKFLYYWKTCEEQQELLKKAEEDKK